MVIATKALLLKNFHPTDEEIHEALKNNYCRCTGYVKIIEAVKLAAARLRGEDPELKEVQTCEPTEIIISEKIHTAPAGSTDSTKAPIASDSALERIPVPSGRYIGRPVRDVDGCQGHRLSEVL